MSEIDIEQEYQEINLKRGWVSLYQTLGETALRNEAQGAGMTFTEAQKATNRKLNRYRDVNPYDHSRVILSRGDTDYINANIVKHEGAKRSYILTQGPLSNTVGHFWLMVWEQNSKAVIMLNKLTEKNVIKCHMYWPSKQGSDHALVMKDVGLRLEYIDHEDCSYFSKRVFKLTDTATGDSREVIQFHYTTWPDFGVPSSPKAFLEFLKKVRSSGALDDPARPAVVHCSAGIGRSGTFCLVDVCLVLIEQNAEHSTVGLDVQGILLGLRRHRTGLIQTADQLRFSYEAIIDGARCMRGQDPSSSSASDYEEVPFAPDKSEGDTAASSESNARDSSSDSDSGSGDDEPPPLPPPRAESLRSGGEPPRPVQESAREVAERFIAEAVDDSIRNASRDHHREAPPPPPTDRQDNKQQHHHQPKDFDRRPLPAIPNSESMDEFMTDLRYSEHYKDDNDKNAQKENCSNDNCPIGKPLPPLPGVTQNSALLNGQGKNEMEMSNNLCNKAIMEDTSQKLIEAMDDCVNLDKSPLSSPEAESDRSNLRKRVRLEKQSVLAEKVRDMKRKQQESERRAQTKRFLLPIGLGLGGLCLLGGALYWYFRTV